MTHQAEAKDKLRCRFSVWIGLLASLVFMSTQLAHAESLPPTVQKALRQARIPASALSISVVPLQGKGRAFHQHADAPVNPASLMKLVTTHAALDLLGPAYEWTTEIRALEAPANGILQGDVYFKGYGDPKLTMERVWLLLRDLRARGVREIRGDLVLDRSYFRLPVANKEFDDDGNQPDRPYLVTPDALLVNFKSLRLSVRAEKGEAVASLDPHLPEVGLENHARITGTRTCERWPDELEAKVEDTGNGVKVMLAGEMPAGCAAVRHIALLDHQTYTASLIKTLWRESGGIWRGGVRQGEAQAQAQVLATSRSPALPLMLRDVNKYSNNAMARQVYLTLGAALGRETDGPDTPSRSNAVVRRWVASQGWSWPELVLENGSGLSRNERISTRHLTDLLAHAWRGPWAAEFISTLPIVAIDGTMRKRLVGEPLAGEAHIKTGTLKGVRSVAGYVRGQNGSVWAVAAVINHPYAKVGGKTVLDEVLRSVGMRKAAR
ncbi:D-alanyl-D-alanine carboxypeptidase / D-alanyl-D-alanine-endopeptidase (penicillin-binding protein 4) [Formivibrio citricus]|uniref:D-alanyl-D-alanine carboxypeptidase / D-alanyl-D-alanine-endopeptidase (Penicillin-binding protein 4) n=1 Tax=Formivibrio citricus TaxID=83765 RepID=A0A1I5BM12_9NEIS|nr:D-alanyl-D-alanine carboxypeptidase/D-alanyl-D-alanine-endopeptidase [Formivibrio citricus]SFN75834.1 D-alanyl-D-alanine carboxypeptidase / D-alanyl-D-alanine-endopeptidase (penicillin-binding protein 4) [Formivibrio citricus]